MLEASNTIFEASNTALELRNDRFQVFGMPRQRLETLLVTLGWHRDILTIPSKGFSVRSLFRFLRCPGWATGHSLPVAPEPGSGKSLALSLAMTLSPARVFNSTAGLATIPSAGKSPHREPKPALTRPAISSRVP
uniref:Uncharacterized protein n=1 Tax=Candidatus Kentrum sp. FM TaxID=2126340 RepID=A0A450RZI9_9GAMM|nr:MAG: hypothetical protein BECKFM1743A_GA0114220_1002010 [Candidatus Kentron sp. FM]VFJ44972.1 MAG: hypothetical protein BECKFM1743C_GA0114222_1001811 [Candidatus Kentron sp. FM]VFK20475.1 MAG: hypothetical protein BECKFM1743B_GA0114221_106992 [Candidatus Kentron sp. FM]